MGANINFESDHTSVTVLLFTTQSTKEKSDLVRTLLENGADFKYRDMYDHSSYYHALNNDYMDIINIFAEYKYNILNELYYYNIIDPDFANITNINVDLLTENLKRIDYAHYPLDLIMEIIESCIELIQ